MSKKKIPYGVSHFETIYNDNYYYVDKTKYIELLESLNEKNIFFLRPRKFGKSLFISLLEYYYGIEHKDKFDTLFGQYYIGKNPTPKASSYYILRFDFSGIDTDDPQITFSAFRKSIENSAEVFLSTYNLLDKNEIKEVLTQDRPSEIIGKLFTKIQNKLDGKKLYILIDEYDHFTNELISFRLPEFKEIVSRNGYVRKFYEIIKEATGRGIVDRFFATGVTPVTLDSLTSGFNIGKDLTLDSRFNEMLGFTDEEVEALLEYYEFENSEVIMSDLHRLYNGSLFTRKSNTRLYNSNMVLYFLSEYQAANSYPQKLIDNNIASDYAKIKNIFYLNNSPDHQQKLKEIIENEETSAVITDKFSFEREFTPDDFVSLLFYNGMITIKESLLSRIVFKIPNYVIKEIYWSFFATLIAEKNNIKFNTDKIADALDNLALNNDIKGWIEQVEIILDLLSNRDYQNFDEKYIKMIFITLASFTSNYIIQSEPEVKGEYPDLMYLFRKPINTKYQFLFELKYLKKSESRKLAKTMELAKEQVTRYLEKPEIKQLENLKSYAVVFVGKKGHIYEA